MRHGPLMALPAATSIGSSQLMAELPAKAAAANTNPASKPS
jgi:hypothetical protein